MGEIVRFLLLSSLVVGGCALRDGGLTVVDTQPCSRSIGTVSRDESIVYSVKANFSLCSGDPENSSALQVSTLSSDASTDYPLVFVTRQGSAVESWTIPFLPPDFSLVFDVVNRTLCESDSTSDEDSALVYVDVFTSSVDNVSFSIILEPVANYTLREETWYPILVGASTPQVHLFEFPSGVDAVTVQAEASSRRCAILSIQNVTCPTNDLLQDIKSKGHYQTMSTDGFLTVTRKAVRGHSFFLVLITTNYSECHGSDYIPLTPLTVNGTVLGFEQTIRVNIRPLETAPPLPIVLPLLIFLAFYAVGIPVQCLRRKVPFKCRWSPFCKCKCTKEDVSSENNRFNRLKATGVEASTTPSTYGAINTTPNRGKEMRGLMSEKPDLKSASDSKEPGRVEETGREDSTDVDKTYSEEESQRRLTEDALQLSIMAENEKDLKLPRMCKTEYSVLQSQYSVYSWNTFTVGIFYALPAFQLVLSQQLLANNSGEEDFCYYNFKCAHPVGIFNSFNNVWSNVGYILLGILFIIITFIREWQFNAHRRRHKAYCDNRGIPQFYGIYYAMGVSLIMEGIMSSLYHICPTNANFQFDTAFMFIIGGLLLTKIFQNRHPDVHANAFVAFFSFAVIIFFTLIGIYYDRRNPLAVRFSLLIIILIMVAGFFTSFYYFHRWKFTKEMFLKVFNGLKFYFTTKPLNWTLLHKIRFLKLIVAFILNILITGICIGGYKYLDIATAILVFFLANVVYFLSAYVITKWWYRETWTPLPMMLPVIIVALWISALFFFLSGVTNWRLTPAESRALNQPCLLMGFYDSHDIWHFLSSCAMFFSFMFIMTLDDGIEDWERNDIQMF